MGGIVVALFAALLVPAALLAVAVRLKLLQPFMLGVMAFTVSQVMVRLPALSYLSAKSTGYAMMSVLHPIQYALFLGITASLAEELARYAAMRLLLKKRSWLAGLSFGAGHGGVEAMLLLGLPAAGMLLSGEIAGDSILYAAGGIERTLAILLHIGLSIVVLRSVVTKRKRYLLAALGLHAIVDVMAVLLPQLLPESWRLAGTELLLGLTAIGLFWWCVRWKRKDGWT